MWCYRLGPELLSHLSHLVESAPPFGRIGMFHKLNRVARLPRLSGPWLCRRLRFNDGVYVHGTRSYDNN